MLIDLEIAEARAESRDAAWRATHHPFAHVALVSTSIEEAVAAIYEEDGAQAALLRCQFVPICGRDRNNFSSADMRLLAIHGLTRKVGQRCDGGNLYRISKKGAEVLSALSEECGW